MKYQRGFTLLELMVSMAIFAMLAVAGWQVFDGVNRARERAQVHADHLAVLQYAYLQLQQDMAQVIPYQTPSSQNISATNNNTNASDSTNSNTQAKEIAPEPFMSLDGEHVSFVRFADPDPRYQSSTSVQRIEYIFTDERLIRRQYTSLEGDSVSLDSVLLEGVTAGRWQAYMPEPSTEFPTNDSVGSNVSSSANIALAQMVNGASTAPDAVMLPKGIAVSFTYQDMPITWQWALAPQPISQRLPNTNGHPNSTNTNEGNNSGNSNDANNNSDTSNGSVENAN
ncbi:type II secretion system minor pseudopilin GspJ [Psychrobacter sp. NG27]|uniref:type II secretion system minor pseudopilin GspJ n=1 Tax=Psychrobacter sp. NG27 TaxID=2781966 RepID=UPI0018DF0544|nr:type II secretion system minor pseudopilin GspJ [Psychrobacter sp. NG27]MBI0425429.1 type II secretion system minor pseudopilin GspJ [Psychrobacter sp. NG27]